jgi:hypothetical protein
MLAHMGLGAEELGAVDLADVVRREIAFEIGAQVTDQEARCILISLQHA